MRISDWSSDVCSSDLFDEYQSQENGKHVKRSMAANARDGFWNGARPPLGYQTIIFERRRDKDKKKLAIDDSEAPLVRKIFDLYLSGDGEAGPMGVKKIASWLNGRGYSYRGKPFHVSNVDDVLRRTKSEEHTSELQSLMRISSAV